MADNRPIGVFDSGLGGLTVLKELEKVLPNENFVYFGDTGRVPYGSRSNETIISYAKQDENFLLSKGVKYIVAACGTVSAVAAHTAKELPVNFMGVVENSVKAAVSATKNQKIGVIGTSATINNGAHKTKILELMPNAKVTTADCPLFVPLVEEGFSDKDDIVVLEVARRYLAPMLEAGVDTLILGCTHYPILLGAIKKIMGENVTLINMGNSTALAVKEELTALNMLNEDTTIGNKEFYVSDLTASFGKISNILLGKKIENVNLVDISKYEGSSNRN
ncbi:MAG: glutamate racemase [Clostridia bacterium]|nr:glutamate racemase [Clostridia bacterium]